MSAILDILIIVIIALSIFFAAKRGFIRTLLGGTSFLIAVAVALAFINPVRDYLGNSSVADKARASLSDTLAGFVSSDSESYDPKLLEDNSAFMNMISVFGIDTEEIREKWQEWRTENTEKLRVDLEEYVSKPVVHAVATVVAFLALFLGSLLILARFFFPPAGTQAGKHLPRRSARSDTCGCQGLSVRRARQSAAAVRHTAGLDVLLTARRRLDDTVFMVLRA